MSEPFLAEIIMFGGNFAPRGWAFCNGQIIPIAQNTAVFSLLGTTYGGNGQTTFALPDLRGRSPMFWGQGPGLTPRSQGEMAGQESVTLLTAEMPAHNHSAVGLAANGNQTSPIGGTWAQVVAGRNAAPKYAASSNVTMNPLALATVGGNQPHNNMQPYLAVTFVIALQGIFPPRP